MKLPICSLFSLLFLTSSSSAEPSAAKQKPCGVDFIKPHIALANTPLQMKNGQTKMVAKNVITDLGLDSGWFKFFFGQANEETAYTFAFDYDDYVLISITDAYCTGDAFDLYKDGSYLITTPRVPTDGCKRWTDDPDKAFTDPNYSNTKFMLPGKFNMTIWTKDSPYQGGAAFIRADTRLATCEKSIYPFVLVTAPLAKHNQVAQVCKRVGGTPAHIDPKNTPAAAQTLKLCGYKEAWFGRLSLLPRSKSKDLGCLAFTVAIPDDPTVDVVDCNTKLPTICYVPH